MPNMPNLSRTMVARHKPSTKTNAACPSLHCSQHRYWNLETVKAHLGQDTIATLAQCLTNCKLCYRCSDEFQELIWAQEATRYYIPSYLRLMWRRKSLTLLFSWFWGWESCTSQKLQILFWMHVPTGTRINFSANTSSCDLLVQEIRVRAYADGIFRIGRTFFFFVQHFSMSSSV